MDSSLPLGFVRVMLGAQSVLKTLPAGAFKHTDNWHLSKQNSLRTAAKFIN